MISGDHQRGRVLRLVHRELPRQRRGPRALAGRVPTDPFLVNGPTVNRALLGSGSRPARGPEHGHRHPRQPRRAATRTTSSRWASSGRSRRTSRSASTTSTPSAATCFMTRDLNPGMRVNTTPHRPIVARRPRLHRRGPHARQHGRDRLRRAAAAAREALRQQLPLPRLVHAVEGRGNTRRRRHPAQQLPAPGRHAPGR